MGKLPLPMALTPTRTTATLARQTHHTPSSTALQVRHATFIARPRRPYTFTQLIQLSDGSTYTARTTSPQSLLAATKDTRNTLLWQPSEKTLHNVELDEAGKLAAFRERFGRAFDIQKIPEDASSGGGAGGPASAEGGDAEDAGDGGYADLISGYSTPADNTMKDSRQPIKKRK